MEPLLHHTVSLMPFSPPEGSIEVSHGHVKSEQIKALTHAPSTRDGSGWCCCCFSRCGPGTGLC